MALIVIEVFISVSGMSVEEPAHLAEVRDRDADLADLAAAERVVGVVAGLRRQVEGHRETGLALGQVGAVERVGRRSRRVAGVRPHDPGTVLRGHEPRVGPGYAGAPACGQTLTWPTPHAEAARIGAFGLGEAPGHLHWRLQRVGGIRAAEQGISWTSRTRASRRVGTWTVGPSVRAGVWTVPAVTLATAAPAFAAASVQTKGRLQFDTFNVFGADYNNKGKPTTLQSLVQVQNVYTAGGPTLAAITVLVTYSGSRVDGSAPQAVSGTGWTFGSAQRSGGDWVYSFVWTGSLVTSHSTPQLSYKVPMKNNSSGQVSISAIASATAVAAATAAASTNL